MESGLVLAPKSVENEGVWTINADFMENYPKNWEFWIIRVGFEEKLSKIHFM